MNKPQCVKRFEVREFSTENMWYRIEVRWRGEIVDVFDSPTMFAARNAFRAAGYEHALLDAVKVWP